MALPLRPRHLKRYVQIARLLARHWNRVGAGDEGLEPSTETQSRSLAADLEEMGPAFIKLGQLLAARPDLAPPHVRRDLARLRDSVEPVGFEAIREVVESELGARIDAAFASFETRPLAAASLGQVHAAQLRSGRPVVVKVQRPGVAEAVATDLSIVRDVAAWLDENTELEARYGLASGLEELAGALERELDYRLEARNLERIGEILADYERLSVPDVIADYSTRRVLTMERVPGTNLGDLSPMARMERDLEPVARELFRAYLDQALVHGLVHADPHPGNLMLRDDGGLALVDLGMVATVPASIRDRLFRLILAVAEREGAAAAQIAEGLGRPLDDYDPEGFRSAVAREVIVHDPATAGRELGEILMRLTALSGAHGLRPSPALALLGKTLLTLEESGRLLAPHFDPADEVRSSAPGLLIDRASREATPTTALRRSLALKDLLTGLPDRAERILDRVEAGEFRIRVDLQGEERLVNSVGRVANRITEGIILASLVVGASLMIRVETSFELFGYPGIALLLFALAALGASRVLWQIWRDPEC